MSTQLGADRRKTLRRATTEAHARLDRAVSDAALLGNRRRYEGYLQATWSARRPAEMALENSNVVALYTAWPQRRLSAALRQDIVDVSNLPPSEARDPLALPLTTGQSLGVLYVLEGSSLGAQILKDRAAEIGMTAKFGARHMAAQTSQPGAWRDFLDLLERTELDTADEDLCAQAAVAAFACFEHAFRHLEVGA